MTPAAAEFTSGRPDRRRGWPLACGGLASALLHAAAFAGVLIAFDGPPEVSGGLVMSIEWTAPTAAVAEGHPGPEPSIDPALAEGMPEAGESPRDSAPKHSAERRPSETGPPPGESQGQTIDEPLAAIQPADLGDRSAATMREAAPDQSAGIPSADVAPVPEETPRDPAPEPLAVIRTPEELPAPGHSVLAAEQTPTVADSAAKVLPPEVETAPPPTRPQRRSRLPVPGGSGTPPQQTPPAEPAGAVGQSGPPPADTVTTNVAGLVALPQDHDARPTFAPAPDYPPVARRRGIEGRVVVRITIAADGRTDTAIISRSSGEDALDQAALAAARRWRFDPASRGGTAAVETLDVPFVFRLSGRR